MAIANLPPGVKPSIKLLREIGFPIFLYPAHRKGRPGIDNRDVWSDTKDPKKWLTDQQWAVLERFQPYHRRKRKGWTPPAPAGKRNPLWQLQEINNADKHRLMQVMAHTARGFSCIVRSCPPIFKIKDISPKLGMRLKDGAYVGTIDFEGSLEGVEMDLRVSPEITFWSGCDAVKGLPVVTTLERILYHVEYDILVPLAKEFRPLDPPFAPPP